jgi:tRNA(Ile)-lysidine synthase TilS/MesJ
MDKFDMEIIRPLCLLEEKEMVWLSEWRGYKKQIKNCPYESGSCRKDAKELLKKMEELNPNVRDSIWSSMHNIQENYLPKKILF